MSELKVEIAEIKNVEPNPFSDNLDLLTVEGWCTQSQRGKFKPGDKCVYFPVDSILPTELLFKVFGEDSKVYPYNGRIKTIRLRKMISQGMAVSLEGCGLDQGVDVGTDVTERLGVKKYQPRKRGASQPLSTKPKKKKTRKILHERFSRYTDMNHLQKHKWYLEQASMEGINVVAHVKLHGTSARYGWVKRTGWVEKLRGIFGLEARWQFLMGSRNVDMYPGKEYAVHGTLPRNVYEQALVKYEMEKRIPKGFTVYGELVGPGIQPGYSYGVQPGDVRFFVYDVLKDRSVDGTEKSRWLNDMEIEQFCKSNAFDRVMEVYRGPFDLETVLSHGYGPDPLSPDVQPVREGVVVRTEIEREIHGVRLLFKFKSPDFLMSKHSEEEFADNAEDEEELATL